MQSGRTLVFPNSLLFAQQTATPVHRGDCDGENKTNPAYTKGAVCLPIPTGLNPI